MTKLLAYNKIIFLPALGEKNWRGHREQVMTNMEEEKVQIEELSENAILIQNACKERYTPHILFHEYCLCYL